MLVFFRWFQHPAPDMLMTPALESLRFFRAFTHVLVFNVLDSILLAVGGLFLLLLIRRLVRNDWIAALIYAVVVMPLSPIGPAQSLTEATVRGLTIMGIAMLVALRLGLLAYATMQLVEHFVLRFPVTLDGDAWYFGLSTIALIVLAALAAYGCLVAVPSQRRVFSHVSTSPPPAVAT
jgi:hypothetical protein